MSEKPLKLTEEMRISNPVQDHSGNPADKARKRDWSKEESYLSTPARIASGWKSKCVEGAKHLAIAFALAGVGVLAISNHRELETSNLVDKVVDTTGAFLAKYMPAPSNDPR